MSNFPKTQERESYLKGDPKKDLCWIVQMFQFLDCYLPPVGSNNE